MKKKIVWPSLFVLNAFLVGMMPKVSKAGSITQISNKETDSVSYTVPFNQDYFLPQKFGQQYVEIMPQIYPDMDYYKHKADSIIATFDEESEANVYNISSFNRCVKYTSEDGCGFIRSGGSRTWRNMNPGAIRHGDFAKQYGACGSAGGFAVFPTEEQGMNALRGLLRSDKYANLTIASAIYKYAPPSDHNDTRSYQRKLSKMTGLCLNRKLNQLTPAELERVVQTIKIIEGWKTGDEEVFTTDNKISCAKPALMQFMKNQRQYNA